MWDARIWDPQFEEFSASRRVIRYDLRGYGRSSEPAGPYSAVEDLRAIVDALRIDQAAIVGESLGGRIAIDFALEQPERVSALVVSASGPGGFDVEDKEADRIMARVEELTKAGEIEAAIDLELSVWIVRRSDPDVDRRIRDIAMENRAAFIREGRVPSIDPPAIGRLAEITVPTLVLIAEADPPSVRAWGEAAAEGIPGAERVVVADADHLINMRRPDEFNRLVLDFLDRAGSGPRAS